MNWFCLELRGPYACFSRPELRVERTSYDFITPSAARACFEAILWKPEVIWRVRRIEILEPVRWINVRRNEVGAVVSTRNVATAMRSGRGDLGLSIEDERQQRAGLLLRDVGYRIHASMEPVSVQATDNAVKYREMFLRRASKGQCVNQPYLGCREFDARFRLVAVTSGGALKDPEINEPPPVAGMNGDWGWMFWDFEFEPGLEPVPRFFRAQVNHGVIELDGVEVRG